MAENADTEPFRLLFVCTGNTCRSPLAEAIARARLAELGWQHVEVKSAGVMAAAGSGASRGSLVAAAANGLDLREHEARLVTAELVEESDLVLTMSEGHLPRIHRFGGGDRAAVITDFAAGEDGPHGAGGVPDPIGGPDSEYFETFRVLEELIETSLARLAPLLDP